MIAPEVATNPETGSILELIKELLVFCQSSFIKMKMKMKIFKLFIKK